MKCLSLGLSGQLLSGMQHLSQGSINHPVCNLSLDHQFRLHFNSTTKIADKIIEVSHAWCAQEPVELAYSCCLPQAGLVQQTKLGVQVHGLGCWPTAKTLCWQVKSAHFSHGDNLCLIRRRKPNLFSFSLLLFLVRFGAAISVLEFYWVLRFNLEVLINFNDHHKCSSDSCGAKYLERTWLPVDIGVASASHIYQCCKSKPHISVLQEQDIYQSCKSKSHISVLQGQVTYIGDARASHIYQCCKCNSHILAFQVQVVYISALQVKTVP